MSVIDEALSANATKSSGQGRLSEVFPDRPSVTR
jgi:hypothetical protein